MVRRAASLAVLLLLLLAALPSLRAQGLLSGLSSVVTTERVRAELVAQAPEGVVAGRSFKLGLLIRHQPHWHTYWRNPGDSGLPTSLVWQLPPGVTVGEIEWPAPQRLPVGPLMNFGYEGEVLLPVTVTLPEDFAQPSFDVSLRADWLVCKDVCVPESGEFRLRLPARAATAGHAALFETARAARPEEPAGVEASARIAGQALAIGVRGLPPAWRGQALQLFVEDPGVLDPAAPVGVRWNGDGALDLEAPLAAERFESPASMHAVLVVPAPPAGSPKSIRIGFEVAGAWPPVVHKPSAYDSLPAEAAAAGLPAAGPAGMAAGSAATGSVWLAVGLAFAGGLLLNLMPCVFPVLSLKILGFARHGGSRRQVAAGGVAYTLGVVLSFLALASVLLALRAGGEQLGWGFQLQSPPFVAALAVLFTLIGLNLAGLFDWRGVLPGNVAALRAHHPLADQALTGVLAVAVASPCSAPFMGAALGAALAQPAAGALAIFAALGCGMAAPYLAASLWPGLAARLPRPGAWMATFRTLMAFPMFATVVWLVWVLGQQVGIDGAAALLGVLLALAFACWAWFAAAPVRSGGRTALKMIGALALGTVLTWAWPSWREPMANATAATDRGSAPRWQPWSPALIERAQGEGRTVLVDFTAAWCVTCQINERFVFTDVRLLADFDSRRVLLLRADWTRRDAAITEALAALGRNAVPVYAVYPPGGGSPELLSELLSVAEVRGALARAAKPPG